jgi:hypothetical protein
MSTGVSGRRSAGVSRESEGGSRHALRLTPTAHELAHALATRKPRIGPPDSLLMGGQLSG